MTRSTVTLGSLALTGLIMTAAPRSARADEPYAIDGHEAEYRTQPSTSSSSSSSGPSGMRIAGGALIGVGTASLVTGALFTASGISDGTEGGGLVVVFVGMPLLGAGVLFNAIGIPLFIAGGPKKESSAQRIPLAPPVSLSAGIGYRSATVTLTF